MALTGFTLAPCWADPPYYSLLVQADELPSLRAGSRLAECVDRHLVDQNVEYEGKRATRRLGPVTLKVLPAGTWEQFVRARLAQRGGTREQYKHPCLVGELEFIHQFRVVQEILPSALSKGVKLA